MMSEDPSSENQQKPPRWQPLGAVDRRVAGALVEKAKTTPSAYPMTLNALVTACNQKSNRSPTMNLEPDDVEESLDRLRKLGAIGLVEGYGRVSKYRHYLYDWLGIDKTEIAVMAELLLRGAQTVGELRGRAARMEPIRDLSELQPVLDSLQSKGLVLSLTPQGRGQVVTHGLYPPQELERVKAAYEGAGGTARGPVPTIHAAAPVTAAATLRAASNEPAKAVEREIFELRSEVAQLRSDLEDLRAAFEQTEEELRRVKDELGL